MQNLTIKKLVFWAPVVAVMVLAASVAGGVFAQTAPSTAVQLSATSVVEGDAITVTMNFGSLEYDSDRATTDYIFRADVKDSEDGDADGCEERAGGYGLGIDRRINLVDEDPEVRRGTIPADCPAGDYTLRASISDADGAELASATAVFSVTAPSNDATLRSLALTGVNLQFDPETTGYTAVVANDVAETTVTPTVNDDGATYSVRLNGSTDGDEVIPLAVGSNAITVMVTAEDGETTKTYTVTVTRAKHRPATAKAETLSTDATLSALTLHLTDAHMTAVAIAPEFETGATAYTATVFADSVKITATATDADATLAVKIGATTFDDGAPALDFGDNTITVAVTAADGMTTSEYTLTVTRLDQIWSATVTVGENALGRGYSSAEIGIGGGSITDTAFTYGGVEYSVLGLGWVEALNTRGIYFSRIIPDDIRENWVVIIDGTRHDFAGKSALPIYHHETNAFIADGYQWTGDSWDLDHTFDAVLGSKNPPHDATLSTLALTHSEGTDVPLELATAPFARGPNSYHAVVDVGITQLNVIATVAGGATTEIVHGIGDTPAENGSITLEPDETTRITVTVTSRDGNATQTYIIRVARSQGGFIYYLLLPDEGGAPPPIKREDVPWLHTQAGPDTLSALELTGIPLVFDPATLDYAVSVGNAVERTTVMATPNDEGATYEVTLNGDADEDGTIELTVGENAVAIVVTAEDGETARTYTVTVTRAEPPTAAVKLSPKGPVTPGAEITVTMTFASLTFDADRTTTDYVFRADVVGASHCENQAGGYGLGVERYIYQVDEDPETRRGAISARCPVGDYAIEVTLTSPGDGLLASARASFSVAAPEPEEPTLSTDATLYSLALSDVNFGAFDPATATYAAAVGNDVAETTVAPAVNHAGATYAVKLDGVADEDEVIPLAVGENVITIVVTAEDGETAKTHTVTVTRAASNDAKLRRLTLTGVAFGPFAPATTDYTAEVGNAVAETAVTPTTNHEEATYVVQLDGVADADQTADLSVGKNAISVVVTAEDGETTLTYAVTVTRAEAPQDPTPDNPPDVPDKPIGEVTGTGQVRLDWNDVAGAESYDVRYFDDNWMELPTGGISIVFDGSGGHISRLKDWGRYYFSVRAVNGAGVSEWSEYNTMNSQE